MRACGSKCLFIPAAILAMASSAIDLHMMLLSEHRILSALASSAMLPLRRLLAVTMASTSSRPSLRSFQLASPIRAMAVAGTRRSRSTRGTSSSSISSSTPLSCAAEPEAAPAPPAPEAAALPAGALVSSLKRTGAGGGLEVAFSISASMVVRSCGFRSATNELSAVPRKRANVPMALVALVRTAALADLRQVTR